MELTPSSQPLGPRLISTPIPSLQSPTPCYLRIHLLFLIISLAIPLADESVEDSHGLLCVSLTQRLDDLSINSLGEKRGHGIPNLLAHESPGKLEV